jgi:hypothetical protein
MTFFVFNFNDFLMIFSCPLKTTHISITLFAAVAQNGDQAGFFSFSSSAHASHW